MLRLLKDAFPDFPPEEIPERVRLNWDDTSYGNDLCPSFMLPGREDLQLWINREKPADRYDGPESPRFSLCHVSDDLDVPVDLYVGDDFNEAMHFADAFVRGTQK